jgi:hypothetical protein
MAYNYWSPWQSRAYAWHQVRVMSRNLLLCLLLVTSLNAAWLILPFHMLWMRNGKNSELRSRQCWRPLIVPFWLTLIYLPASIMVSEQRFFYPAFPFLFTAVALWAMTTSKAQGKTAARWRLAAIGIAAPLIATILVLGFSPKYAGDCAADMANRMRKAHLVGPIAGSGQLPGGRAGLYVAFLLGQPWYGDELEPTPATLKASGAQFIVVVRSSELTTTLGRDPNFVDCDERLFGMSSTRPGSPLKLYEVKGWQEAAGH